MAQPDYFLGEGADSPLVVEELVVDGERIVTIGGSFVFRYRDKDQDAAEVEEPAITIAGDDGPNIQWNPLAALPPGDYNVYWFGTTASGKKVMVPDGPPGRYFWLHVHPKP